MDGSVDNLLEEMGKITGVKPVPKIPTTKNPFERAAQTLGVDPVDLATIVSFESAGTFDPDKVGGEGNKYRGLIQFGIPEQKRYYKPGQTMEDQLNDGVVRYFQDRFKSVGKDTRGATLEDLYTTVIAGNPKANRNARDAFGTSARSGVERMLREHRPKVLKKFFGGTEPLKFDTSSADNLLGEMRQITESKADFSPDDLLSEMAQIAGKGLETPQVSPATTPATTVVPDPAQEQADIDLLTQSPSLGQTDWGKEFVSVAPANQDIQAQFKTFLEAKGKAKPEQADIDEFNQIQNISQESANKENQREGAVTSAIERPSAENPSPVEQSPFVINQPESFTDVKTTLRFTGKENEFEGFVKKEIGRELLNRVPGAIGADVDAALGNSKITAKYRGAEPTDITVPAALQTAVAEERDKRILSKRTDFAVAQRMSQTGESDLDAMLNLGVIDRDKYAAEQAQRALKLEKDKPFRNRFVEEKTDSYLKSQDYYRFDERRYGVELDKETAQRQAERDANEILAEYGSFEKYYKEQRDRWKRIAENPNSAALEFTKNLVRTAPKAVSALFKATAIGAEGLNKFAQQGVIGSAVPDLGEAKDMGLFQFGKWIDRKTDEFLPQDEQLKKSFLLTTLPDALGQLVTQIGLGAATGGVAVPLLFGVSQGAAEQYEEADRFKADRNTKLLASLVGGLASAPDILPIAKWLKPLNQAEKSGFLTRLINSVFAKNAEELGEAEAESLAKQFIRNSFKGGLFEGGQEVSENKINDALASLTYDKKRKVFTINGRDVESFFAGFIGGNVGGSIQTTLENKYELEDLTTRISPEQVRQSLEDAQNGVEKQKYEPKEARVEIPDVSPIVRRQQVDQLSNLGYSPQEIDRLKPDEAVEIITEQHTPQDWKAIREAEKGIKAEDFKLEETLKAAESPQNETPVENVPTLSHPNPDIDGKEILAQKDDGKVVVANPSNKNGISIVKPVEADQETQTETQPREKLRSLPQTMRQAGLEASDELYKVFGNEQARKEADDKLSNLGIDKSLKDLETKTSYDKADAVLSVKLQRVLQNQAKAAEENGETELAKEYRTRSLELASKHAELATKAGQFTQAAAMIATTADGVVFHANKIAKEKGKGLTKSDYTTFETLGTKGEDSFNTLEIYQNEIKNLRERVAELEKGNRTPLENYSRRVTNRAKSKIGDSAELRAKILKKFKLPSQAGTVVVRPAKPTDEITEYGASLLLDKSLSQIKREDFYTEMRSAFGRRFEDDLPKIFADSLNLRNKILAETRGEIQTERLKAEFPDASEAELEKIAAKRAKEKEVKKQTGNLAKKLAKLYSPVRAKETEKILTTAESLTDDDAVLDYAERLLTKEAEPADLKRASRKTYLEAQKLIDEAKQVIADEKEAIKAEIAAGRENLKTLEREEYFQRQRIKQVTQDLAREYKRLEESPVKFFGKEGLKLLGETRSLLASGDLSGSLRQGFYFSVTNPLLNLKGTEDLNGAFGGMLKSAWLDGKNAHADLMVQIEKHPNFDTMLKMGIEFADAGTDFSSLTGAEENIRTEYIKRVPGAKQWLEWSERTYSGFLDLQRALMADSVIKELESQGLNIKKNPEEFEAAGKLINIASGRGNLTGNKQLNDAVNSFGRVLFAPRYAVSRFQLLNHLFNPASIATLPPATRKIMVKRALRFHAAVSLPLLAAGAMGLVSIDPDDDDFLKIRVGQKARYEATGGLQSYFRYLARMGKALAFSKNAKEAGRGVGNINLNFWSKKLAPIPSYGYAAMTGKEADTSEFHWLKGIYMRMLPITLKEFGGNTYEDGALGFVSTIPSLVGIGTGYYKDKNTKPIKNDLNKTVQKVREKFIKPK